MNSCKFICGANEIQNNSFVGETMSFVVRSLGLALNITSDMKIKVNGDEVEDDYIIEEGDEVEFVKNAGAKGSEVYVVVSHGANEVTVTSRDGSTVAEVIRQATAALGIVGLDGLTIKRNGVEVDNNARVAGGDRIEVNKSAGSKGL